MPWHLPAAAQPCCFHRPDPGPSPCTGRQPGPPAAHAPTGPFPCVRWSRPAPHAPGPPARPTRGPRSHESYRPFSVRPPTQSGSVCNRPSGPAAFTGPIRPAPVHPARQPGPSRLTLPSAHSRASADPGRLRLHPAQRPCCSHRPAFATQARLRWHPAQPRCFHRPDPATSVYPACQPGTPARPGPPGSRPDPARLVHPACRPGPSRLTLPSAHSRASADPGRLRLHPAQPSCLHRPKSGPPPPCLPGLPVWPIPGPYPTGPFPRVRRSGPSPFATGPALRPSPVQSGPPRLTRPANPLIPDPRSRRR
jgi:hypothetical protein